MAKDPAFLFYSKDWIQGTANLMPEEKGIYIDLLAHQHQDGDLPSDTKRLARLVGLSEQEFLPIWEVVKLKFIEKDGNRLVNRKLTEIATKRLTKSITNTITGNFAALLRLSGLPHETKEELKKSFKIDHFMTESTKSVKERLTEWLEERLGTPLKSIANTSINVLKLKTGDNGKFIGNYAAQGEELLAKRINEGLLKKAEQDRKRDSGSET